MLSGATMWVVNGISHKPSDKYSCTRCNKEYSSDTHLTPIWHPSGTHMTPI